MSFCLGRKPALRTPGIRALAQFTRGVALPPPPKAVDWHAKVQGLWPMLLNDRIGCCTISAEAHCETVWTANRYATDDNLAQPPEIMSDAAVLADYRRLSGYVPGDASTDTGLYVDDVMADMIARGKIDAAPRLNCTDLDEICDAIAWFGCAYFGINLPKSALDNVNVWDVVNGSPMEGGHAIMSGKYDTTHTGKRLFWIISWGMEIPVTSEFLLKYLDEARGPISRDFILASGKAPSGLSLDDMIANSKALA